MSNGEGGSSGTEFDIKKLEAVADWMASAEEAPFRGYLSELARGKKKKVITEYLKSDDMLAAYLQALFDSSLNRDELDYCARWGISCVEETAKKVGTGNKRLMDKIIVRHLTKYKNFNINGPGSIGG